MKFQHTKNWLRHPSRGRTIFIESAILLSVLILFSIAIARVTSGAWADIFFNNGDSLTLAMISESLSSREPFGWVLSSQLFAFPEAIIFFIADLLTTSVRSALILNAFINASLLYILLRLIAGSIFGATSLKARVGTVSAVLFYVLFVSLEAEPHINTEAIAGLFLFSTYYSGVILSGLAIVLLSLRLLKSSGERPVHNNWVLLISLLMISALTTLSNPLFILQVFLPLATMTGLMFLLNHINFSSWIMISGATTTGVIIGYIGRSFLKHILPADINKYIDTQKIPESLTTISQTLSLMVSSGAGKLKLSILIFLIAIAMAFVFYYIYQNARKKTLTTDTKELLLFFVASFVLFSCLLTVVGYIVTGSTTTRYLIPLYIFSAMSSLLVFCLYSPRYQIRRHTTKRIAIMFMCILLAVSLSLAGVKSSMSIAQSLSSDMSPSRVCLERYMAKNNDDGLADFWTARPLDIYSKDSNRILQITSNLEVFDWMINLSSYENRSFGFVLVSENSISSSDISTIGQPTDIISCGEFEIYTYSGTNRDRLNTMIQNSLNDKLSPRIRP